MGRHAGFIAAAATVASQDVNICLVTEQPFSLDGLLAALEKRLVNKSHAVHAAMSGRTGLVISFLQGQFAHVPIDIIAAGGKRLDLEGELWRAVLSSTGQPARFI